VLAGLAEGRPFLRDLIRFSGSITNGDFGEGWSLPWAYQWHLEHGVMIVLVAGIVLTAVSPTTRRAGLVWLMALAAIYGGLVVGSNVLQRFVVYDRLARQLFPFMCLAAAPGLAALNRRWVVYAAVGVLFAMNYWSLATLRFPREIVREAIERYGAANIGLATTFPAAIDATSPLFLPPEVQPRAEEQARRYLIVNPRDIWIEGAAEVSPLPAGTIIETFVHPRQLPPLQYHGYRPEIRALMRASRASIIVVDTGRRP
jgi:hypothetical protein